MGQGGSLWREWRRIQLSDEWGPAPEDIIVSGQRFYLYWADLHVHSILTPDAEGEVDELIHFARDKARLSVLAFAENDSNSWLAWNPQGAFRRHRLTEAEYPLSLYYARRYHDPGWLVILPSWECSQRTDDNKPNYRTVLFAGSWAPILRRTEDSASFEQLCDLVEAAGSLLITKHEWFRLSPGPCETNIELASGWDMYIDQSAKIHSKLMRCKPIAFVATNGGHRRNRSLGGALTGIFASSLSRQAILQAIRARRVFAVSGNRVYVQAWANAHFMGEAIVVGNQVRCQLKVSAPESSRRLAPVRDGQVIHEARPTGTVTTQTFVDRPSKSQHWY